MIYTCSKHNYTGLNRPCPDCENESIKPVLLEELKTRPTPLIKIKGDAGNYELYGIDWMHYRLLIQRGCGLEWVDWEKCKQA
jgi:hypothetical protein